MKQPPKTLAQATALLGHYAQVSAQLADVEADRQRRIGAINAEADKEAARLQGELEVMSKRLQPWWDANGEQLVQGKKKSATISNCTIGYSLSSPKLVHGFKDDDAAIAALKGTRLYKQATSTKVSLDKTAIRKLLKGEGKTAETLTTLGFKLDQQPVFFIERADPASDVAG